MKRDRDAIIDHKLDDAITLLKHLLALELARGLHPVWMTSA
jgi:hypothetical protein